MVEKLVKINTIQGYENIRDCYWLSNGDEDKIINKDTGKMMKIRTNKNRGGYKMIDLRAKEGKKKTYRVHILKASAFLFGPNPLGYNLVRHLDDCKVNNRLENLAFGTLSQNTRDSIRNGRFNYEAAVKAAAISAKKRSKPVRCIETGMIYVSTREAERKLGIHHANISSCCLGKCKTAGDLHWEFANQENKN